MTYHHFDLDQIEKQTRAMRDAHLPQALEAAKGEMNRAGILAQDALFEAQLSATLHTFKMKNEGRSPRFIGAVLGVFVANVIANTISCSDDPNETWDAMSALMGKAINDAFAPEEADDSATIGSVTIVGDPGGRA